MSWTPGAWLSNGTTGGGRVQASPVLPIPQQRQCMLWPDSSLLSDSDRPTRKGGRRTYSSSGCSALGTVPSADPAALRPVKLSGLAGHRRAAAAAVTSEAAQDPMLALKLAVRRGAPRGVGGVAWRRAYHRNQHHRGAAGTDVGWFPSGTMSAGSGAGSLDLGYTYIPAPELGCTSHAERAEASESGVPSTAGTSASQRAVPSFASPGSSARPPPAPRTAPRPRSAPPRPAAQRSGSQHRVHALLQELAASDGGSSPAPAPAAAQCSSTGDDGYFGSQQPPRRRDVAGVLNMCERWRGEIAGTGTPTPVPSDHPPTPHLEPAPARPLSATCAPPSSSSAADRHRVRRRIGDVENQIATLRHGVKAGPAGYGQAIHAVTKLREMLGDPPAQPCSSSAPCTTEDPAQ
eukprot:TRINITY_DN2318_c0_g2_i1.p1 TRINITY_DN2318_c0_g2~~TRINITY_DN2318_c0_g2_i1.p1  ORF type:complete len:405 (+),score=80.40 TRINITY_DN2318_c0_g2_i1:86-1300(+)